MDTRAPRWTVFSELGAGAFAASTLEALDRLGYDLEASESSAQDAPPDVLLLNESAWRVRQTEDGPPVIVVRSPGASGAIVDPRVVATVIPPLRLSTLYTVLQSALEKTPRQTPRVATALPARCADQHRGFPGAVVSLSEGGCLFRSAVVALPDDAPLHVLFPLPRTPMISIQARVTERQGNAIGLRFDNPTELSRAAIARYVEEQILVA